MWKCIFYIGLFFTAISTVKCCTQLNAAFGATNFLPSPGYDGISHYDHNLDECWEITAEAGYVLRIDTVSFDLQDSTSCHYDFVLISCGLSSDSLDDMGLYCGSEGPISLMSGGETVTIQFVTDNSGAESGFLLSYEAVESSEYDNCGDYESDSEEEEIDTSALAGWIIAVIVISILIPIIIIVVIVVICVCVAAGTGAAVAGANRRGQVYPNTMVATMPMQTYPTNQNTNMYATNTTMVRPPPYATTGYAGPAAPGGAVMVQPARPLQPNNLPPPAGMQTNNRLPPLGTQQNTGYLPPPAEPTRTGNPQPATAESTSSGNMPPPPAFDYNAPPS